MATCVDNTTKLVRGKVMADKAAATLKELSNNSIDKQLREWHTVKYGYG
jgi:hypothetical protein